MPFHLDPSWRTTASGILTIVVPPSLFGVLTLGFKMQEQDALSISGAFMTILVGLGLAHAKDAGVSNAPDPIPKAQAVPKKKVLPPPGTLPIDAPVQVKPSPPSNGRPHLE
jgi:hypothetical protein